MSNLQAVSFTGHRPSGLEGFNPMAKRQLSALLRAEILDAVDNGATVFYSGMAMGIDLLAARQVLLAKQKHPEIQLIAVLPFEGQEAQFEPEWKALFLQVRAECDQPICLYPRYQKGCYRDRNQWLVDHCDRLIAVYNGQAHSGTAQTIHMAQKAQKQLRLFGPDLAGNIQPLEACTTLS